MTHDDITSALKAVADEIKSRLDGEFPDVPDEFRVHVEASIWAGDSGVRLLRAAVYHEWMAAVDAHESCGAYGRLETIADNAVDAAITKMRAAIDKARRQTNGLYQYVQRQEVTP